MSKIQIDWEKVIPTAIPIKREVTGSIYGETIRQEEIKRDAQRFRDKIAADLERAMKGQYVKI